jgi:hypothetical protein
MLNPCGEIPLGEPEVMQPEWQLMLMNTIRQKQGLPPYTREEAEAILDSLLTLATERTRCFWTSCWRIPTGQDEPSRRVQEAPRRA